MGKQKKLKVNELKTVEDLVRYEGEWLYDMEEYVFNTDMSQDRYWDWRDWVAKEYRQVWQKLSREVRLMLYMGAIKDESRMECIR